MLLSWSRKWAEECDPYAAAVAWLATRLCRPARELQAQLARQLRRDRDIFLAQRFQTWPSGKVARLCRRLLETAPPDSRPILEQWVADQVAGGTAEEAGRRQALEFLGLQSPPPRLDWRTLKNAFLFPRVRGLAAPPGPVRQRLAQDLQTLQLNRGWLFQEGALLRAEALLGLDPPAAGRTRLSIVRTKFLGSPEVVQFWGGAAVAGTQSLGQPATQQHVASPSAPG